MHIVKPQEVSAEITSQHSEWPLSEAWQTLTDGEGGIFLPWCWGYTLVRDTLKDLVKVIKTKKMRMRLEHSNTIWKSWGKMGRTCDNINYRSFWINLIEQWKINPKPGKHNLLPFQSKCPKKDLKEWKGNPGCKEIFANQRYPKQFISKTKKQLTAW